SQEHGGDLRHSGGGVTAEGIKRGSSRYDCKGFPPREENQARGPIMSPPPPPRPRLLVRLRDGGGQDAWRQFGHLYPPVVFGWARRRGLQEADAADLTQEVLRSVARALPAKVYDPTRGPFRGWLYTVTRNKLNTFQGRQARAERGSGDSDVQEMLEAVEA